MLRKISAWLLFLGAVAPLSAGADDSLAKFKGGIGVIPVSAGVVPAGQQPLTSEVVNRNFVRGVPPPGQIWVIAALNADVKTDGSVKVRGKGLLLGGGNTIGTNANQSVRATLICDAAGATRFDTGLVALEPNGDFRIDDVLRSDTGATPPNPCASPVLLIRNPAGAWFAAGIPDLSNDD